MRSCLRLRGVILLIVFTVVASLLLLRFWEVDVPPMRVGMQNGMVANIGVVGGLLLLLQNVRCPGESYRSALPEYSPN